jgi:Fe-S-cluster containining protein
MDMQRKTGANLMPEVDLPIHQDKVCRHKPHREDLKAGEVLCTHCGAKCCRYFAFPIDTPTEWQDFDYLRWYLLHEHASVFVEDDCWYLLVHNRCKYLGDDHLCGIYETRPQICRDYTTDNCEYEDDWVYEHYWETPEQIEEYAAVVLGPREGESIRSPKPKLPNP